MCQCDKGQGDLNHSLHVRSGVVFDIHKVSDTTPYVILGALFYYGGA